mgnify:CR=1 FL=1|tara:strand:- start:12201 stop:13391 length:1191 start_codon:yes stop_codon:yes gene_type:complete
MDNKKSSSKSKKIKLLQATIRRKLQSSKNSKSSKKYYVSDLLNHSSKTTKIQNFMKKTFANKFKLNNRLQYYNYINDKLKEVTATECLEEKNFKDKEGFTIRNIINLEKKIGIEGFNGYIYLTSVKNAFGSFPIATKLMGNTKDNLNEISLMRFITDNIIKKKYSKHFLMTYKSCICNIDDYPKDRKLISINEIAAGDLNTLLNNEDVVRNKELLYNLLFQSIISIATFHNTVNNVHQDIHAGNFLWHKNNEKGYYHYIFNDESYYLKACEYNIMLYDFGYAKKIRSKKSILKILSDYSELLPSFLKNVFEDDLPLPEDDIIQEFYSIIEILMVEYRTISQKYKPTSSSPGSKKKYQEIYFNFVIDKILMPYSPNDMFTKKKPKKVINSEPFYINI